VTNDLKGATDKPKNETICDDIMEMQRTGGYNLMYIQTEKLGCRENHGVKIFASQTLTEID